MENGRVEAGGGAANDELLVDGAQRIVAARGAAEEAHVAVGPETPVAEPDAAKVVLERQRVGGGIARGKGAQLRGSALVGVDGEDPLAARLRPRELVLAGEVVERPLEEPRSRSLRDLARPVARAAIHHQDLVAEAAHRSDAVGQVALLVLRDDGGGEPRHRSDLSLAMNAVVEWSLGSPAITVRPPQLATSARSGTLSGV